MNIPLMGIATGMMGGGGLSLRSIPSIALWLRGDNAVGADGAAVSSWPDLSGNGNHAVQADDGKQPVKKTGIINGHAVVRTDGTDNYLTAPIPQSNVQYWFMVFKKNGANSTAERAVAQWGAGTFIGTDSDIATNYWFYSDSSFAAVDIGGDVANFGLLEMRFESASVLAVNWNAVQTATFDPNNSFYATGFTIGGKSSGFNCSDIDYAEIVMYTAIPSAENIAKIRTALKNRYGLSF